MGYFPMCVDLTGKLILLVGSGRQIEEKEQKLRPFGAQLRRIGHLTAEHLKADAVLVVVGDTDPMEAKRIHHLCTARRIPVNVVDMPELCTFTFPAMVAKGDLTISVSTGGKVPGAAAYLAKQIDDQLPDRTGEILDWLHEMRQELYMQYPKDTARTMLSRITRTAFALGRPLTAEEAEADCL